MLEIIKEILISYGIAVTILSVLTCIISNLVKRPIKKHIIDKVGEEDKGKYTKYFVFIPPIVATILASIYLLIFKEFNVEYLTKYVPVITASSIALYDVVKKWYDDFKKDKLKKVPIQIWDKFK